MDLYKRSDTDSSGKAYFTGSGLRLEHLKNSQALMQTLFGRSDQTLYDTIRDKISDHKFSIFEPVTAKDLANVRKFVQTGLNTGARFGREVAEDEDSFKSVESIEEDLSETLTGRNNLIRENYKAIVQMIALFSHFMDIQTKPSGDSHSIMKMFVLMAGLGDPKEFGYQKMTSEKLTPPRIADELKRKRHRTLTNDADAEILIKSCINAALMQTEMDYGSSASYISRYYNDTSEKLNLSLFLDFNNLLKTMGIDVFRDEETGGLHPVTTRTYSKIIKPKCPLWDQKFNLRNLAALEDGNPETWLDHTSSTTKYNINGDSPTREMELIDVREDIVTNTLQVMHELQCLKAGAPAYGLQQYIHTQKILRYVIMRKTSDLPIILFKLYEKIISYPELLQPVRVNHFQYTELDNDNEELAKFLNKQIEERFEKVVKGMIKQYRELGWNNKTEYQDAELLKGVLLKGPNEAGIESIGGSVQVFETKATQDNEEVNVRYLITANRGIILLESSGDRRQKLGMEIKEAEIDAQIVNGKLTITSDGL